jgi:2,3-bisphosphoglycerate-independent phosphoglycerate mutase
MRNNLRRVLTVILDGYGISNSTFGNAVANAHKPNFNWLVNNAAYRTLFAHGTHVGLPSNADMGNSEVGHNALGAGRIFDQGAKLVQNAIADRSLFQGLTWTSLIRQVNNAQSTLHFIGLLSDGNVHSHEQHLYSCLHEAARSGVKKIRIHVLLDGRDVGERSAEIYVDRLEKIISEIRATGVDISVASGGGRMQVTMDRYEADWAMVERGWKAHVEGDAPNHFESLSQAIKYFRCDEKLSDQNFPAFVIKKNDKPVGPICDHDAVVLFNFRGDRAIEITQAFTDPNFRKVTKLRHPNVFFAGMMQYDGDVQIPKHYLVSPPLIDEGLGVVLAQRGIRQFACSETQKFGHVTYFWNGNRSGYIDEKLETYIEIPSDNINFDAKPWMKAHEITEATLQALRAGCFDFGRINFPNGDMVGHTGNYEAAKIAIEVIDLMLGKIKSTCDETNTILIVTADHGNADEMFDAKSDDYPDWENLPLNKRPKPKTSHTLNPVPFIIYDPNVPLIGTSGRFWTSNADANLGNFANTALDLMGSPLQKDYLPSLLSRST